MVCAESCIFCNIGAIRTPPESSEMGLPDLAICQYDRGNRLFTDQTILHALILIAMKRITVFLSACIILAANLSASAQCAMCRGTVESTVSNGRSVVASDLNFGIIYLLAIPYLMVGVVAFVWYRNSRKEYAKRLEITSRVRGAMSRL